MVAQARIRDGVLWVGGEAYPLRNIAHVGQRVLTVDRDDAWKKFVIRSVGCFVLGSLLSSVGGIEGTIAALIVEAFVVWNLVIVLRKPTVYGLVLNTSGVQHEAIWSTREKEIGRLVFEITKAIGSPDVAQTVVNVEHAVQGDLIQQYGAGSIGKAEHSGTGRIG
ncbi:DUF6232 family protein [Streptomyces buecherae]|uniref:DUF6232 family protein n=1 Tax=Streptomyces buecherae TaxID=2763006 RepID=UPI00368B7ACE